MTIHRRDRRRGAITAGILALALGTAAISGANDAPASEAGMADKTGQEPAAWVEGDCGWAGQGAAWARPPPVAN